MQRLSARLPSQAPFAVPLSRTAARPCASENSAKAGSMRGGSEFFKQENDVYNRLRFNWSRIEGR